MNARELLLAVDRSAEAGRTTEAKKLLRDARFAASREGDGASLAAVMRREAFFVEPGERAAVLSEAARLARRAHDPAGEIEALEDLARDAGTAGRVGQAVALLGRCAEIQAQQRDHAGLVRAVMLAGRALCEAWGAERDVPAGMVMLLWAQDEAHRVDDSLAHMLRDYLTGFQYTLSDADFAEVEPWLGLDRRAVVDATFARYASTHAQALP